RPPRRRVGAAAGGRGRGGARPPRPDPAAACGSGRRASGRRPVDPRCERRASPARRGAERRDRPVRPAGLGAAPRGRPARDRTQVHAGEDRRGLPEGAQARRRGRASAMAVPDRPRARHHELHAAARRARAPPARRPQGETPRCALASRFLLAGFALTRSRAWPFAPAPTQPRFEEEGDRSDGNAGRPRRDLGWSTARDEPLADTLATVAAGRTALVARLRTIAARVEELPLDAAADVQVLLEPTVAALEREAALALERAPRGAQ